MLGLVACGESEQVVVYKQGKYQGKPDGLPWDNEPARRRSCAAASGPRATARAGKKQIKNRQLAQHEHKRIYQ